MRYRSIIRLVLQEFVNPFTIGSSLLTGLLINYLDAGKPFQSPIPFVLPFLLQWLGRILSRYESRHAETLLEMSELRQDPAFVMDLDGNIMPSGGRTAWLFSKLKVKHVSDFLDPASAREFFGRLKQSDYTVDGVEVRSKANLLWYEVKSKLAAKRGGTGRVFVWFNDITERKILDARLSTLLQHSDETLRDLPALMQKKDVVDRLARIIVTSGWQAVFIARRERDGNSHGCVYTGIGGNRGDIEKSDPIVIEDSLATPILRSKVETKVIQGNMREFPTRAEFEAAFQFDRRIVEALGVPVDSFIHYHESEFAVVAFNKRYEYSRYDRILLQTLLNNTRSIFSLIDLAAENDAQFLQKVMGLCAAAEYSDRVTGKHILRINEYAKFIAGELGQNEYFVGSIGTVAALHDIGKVAMPELIKLDRRYEPDERDRMKMHTVFGAHILKAMAHYASRNDPKMGMAYNIALHHHQNWNGSGYPGVKRDGRIEEPESPDYKHYLSLEPLKGEEIPTEALITSLADVYDALRSERPYKKGLSHEEALALVRQDDRTGTRGEDKYGPGVWGVLERKSGELAKIYASLL